MEASSPAASSSACTVTVVVVVEGIWLSSAPISAEDAVCFLGGCEVSLSCSVFSLLTS